MQEILYDARWIGLSGMGRFAGEVSKRVAALTYYRAARVPWHAADPALLSAMLWRRRPKLFFSPGFSAPITSPCPFVFTLHDLHHLRVPERSSAAKRAYYRHMIRPACHRAAFVLTVSEFSKREIVEWAGVRPEKVINVGNGIGPPFVSEGAKHAPGFPYLLYVGSRKPHKNLPRLMQAFGVAGLPADVRLILAGWEGPELGGEIQRLGLGGRVICRRCDSDEELASLYRGALGFVFASLYEGFGIPPLEAMACGCPVVTSNAAAIPEVLGDAGLLVDGRNVDEIAAGIHALVEDAGLRERLRQKGFARAKKFTWDETARKISLVLETCGAPEHAEGGQESHAAPAMPRNWKSEDAG